MGGLYSLISLLWPVHGKNGFFTEQAHDSCLWAESVQEVSALSFLTKDAGHAGFISSVATDSNTIAAEQRDLQFFALTVVCKLSVTKWRQHPSVLPANINQNRIM